MSKSLLCLTLLILSLELSFAKYSDDPKAQLTYQVFNELRSDNTDILNQFYAEGIEFKDPVGEINGLEAMKTYYKEMYKNVESIRFDFRPFSVSEDRYFFPWTMYLKTPSLNSGEEFGVEGVSEIHFNGELVTFHRDYFDMGEFIYERLPVFGRIVKTIRKRLQHK